MLVEPSVTSSVSNPVLIASFNITCEEPLITSFASNLVSTLVSKFVTESAFTCEEPLITVLASNLVSTLVSKFVIESASTWDEPEITPSASNFNFTFASV